MACPLRVAVVTVHNLARVGRDVPDEKSICRWGPVAVEVSSFCSENCVIRVANSEIAESDDELSRGSRAVNNPESEMAATREIPKTPARLRAANFTSWPGAGAGTVAVTFSWISERWSSANSIVATKVHARK